MDPKDIRDADGGFASRKFWLAMLTQMLVVAFGVASGFLPELTPALTTVCGSLVTVLTVYVGGNVATRWVHTPDEPKAPESPP